MSRFFAPLLLVLAAPVSLSAADVERNTPYRLQVIVHLAKHRLLTDVFRERLERELRDGLQAAFGAMVQVEVGREHPLLREVLDKGLQKALDACRDRTPVKTHFVLVDCAGLDYVIQARQYDGYCGQPSPVVRTERTRDRDFVARAAALLIERDFGLSGTVVTPPDAQGRVKVDLRSVPGVPLVRMVQKDEVFALVQVHDASGPTQKVNWAFLQVAEPPKDENDTSCLCRVFTRYEVPSIVGDRCLKLGTGRLPLRVRLVRQTPGQALLKPLQEPLFLYVRRHGFTGEDTTRLRDKTDDRDSLDTSSLGEAGLYEHLAFLTVQNGETPLANVPVPLLDEQPVIVPISAARVADDPLLVHRESWVQSVSFSYLRQSEQLKAIQKLAAQPNTRARAIEAAKAELQRSRADHSRLSTEHADLVTRAAKLPQPPRLNLTTSEERLRRLKEGADELEGFVAQLEKINREENDPARKAALQEIERARLLERDGEIGKALEIYEKLLKQRFDVVNLQQKVDELRKVWVPKNDKHKDARAFIFEVWPTLDNVGLKAHLEDVRKAFATCKDVGDLLGPQKLLDVTVAHGLRMEREVAELKPNLNPEDEKPARLIEELAPQLEKLARDIDAYLKKARGG
jgi:hypothetical protein